MTDQHRATSEQWANVSAMPSKSSSAGMIADCLLELRDRVAALEDACWYRDIHLTAPAGSLVERMDIYTAIGIIESCAGFTESDTPVGEAWAVVLSYLHYNASSAPSPETELRQEGWA